jgi:phosphoglycolate phosphatase
MNGVEKKEHVFEHYNIEMTNMDWSAVRVLIFDLDGTLIDSKHDLIHAVNAMMRELGRAGLAEETVASYIGHGAPRLVARSLGENCTEAERQRALEYFMSYYEEHKLDATRAYPGVVEALEQLRPLPMAVLTNKPARISKQILDALGLSKFFRIVYGGDSFETKKPHPLGASTILRELGVAAKAGLLIGDSDVDVQTARHAGMFAAAVNYGFGVHDRAAFPADVYLDSLGELTRLVPRVAG